MQRKKERKRARDMDRDHTFDLPDLTEDFWKTVVFAQEDPPSGMGGPGCVCLLSKEGKEYIFGFEETPFYKSTELFPIFETTDERIGYRHKYKAEDHGWKYLEKENALIREDILDEMDSSLDVMFVCNPNNPTGILTPRSLLDQILKKAEGFLRYFSFFLRFDLTIMCFLITIIIYECELHE